MATITDYEISAAAELDIEEVYQYGCEKYGHAFAIEYLEKLGKLFSELVNHPFMGKKRSEIKKELRNIPLGEYIVFYRLKETHVRIVRVLHHSKDLFTIKFFIP